MGTFTVFRGCAYILMSGQIMRLCLYVWGHVARLTGVSVPFKHAVKLDGFLFSELRQHY